MHYRADRQCENIRHLLALLATCHTVIPEMNAEKPGLIKYQAASPDEGALVDGAVTWIQICCTQAEDGHRNLRWTGA